MRKIFFAILIITIPFLFGGCLLTGTLIFNNWLNNSYYCYIDGVYQGTVLGMGYLTVYNVPIGYHYLEAENTATGFTYAENYYVNVGTNYWDFN